MLVVYWSTCMAFLLNYDIKVKPVFTYTKAKLFKYFILKERCSKLFSFNIVYKFTRPPKTNCTSYIGESKWQFFKRIEVHKYNDKNSILYNHIQNCYGCRNCPNLNNQFKIIKICQQERSTTELRGNIKAIGGLGRPNFFF